MQIKHELVRQVLLTWAADKGQAYVANVIAEKYLDLGGDSLPLVKGNTWNNQQYIFHRWIYCDTQLKRQKMRQLLPAILLVLPRKLNAQLLLTNSMQYRALEMAVEGVTEAADAFVSATVVDVVSKLNSAPDSLALVLH
ncbi:MAG: toxin YdaT family protein [Enterobacter ludwigii]|nr:toxin YdaT family protein [Enterobacter ludwigii]